MIPAEKMEFREGVLLAEDTEPMIGEQGVTLTTGLYEPTAIFLEGLADKLQIPTAYLKRTHATRPDIFDATANGWLRGRRGKVSLSGDTLREPVAADPRSFMVRAYSGGSSGSGVARAFLSDQYGFIDNFDALTACLQGSRPPA